MPTGRSCSESEASQEMAGFRELRSRLFKKARADSQRTRAAAAQPRSSRRCSATRREAAVAAVKEALARNAALRGGVPRHAHAAGPGRGVGGDADPRAGSGGRDRHLHRLFRRRSVRDRRLRAARRQALVPAEAVSSARSAADDHRARQQVARRAAHREARLLRHADRAAEPRAVAQSPGRARCRRRRRTAAPWRCCTWISTTSSASTTPSVTPWAMSCCAWSRSGCAARCAMAADANGPAGARARATSRASAAMNSWCCCRTCAAPSMPAAWPSG